MAESLYSLQSLNEMSDEIKGIHQQADRLSKRAETKKGEAGSKSEQWQKLLEESQRRVREGTLSVGSDAGNYVLANFPFSRAGSFSEAFQSHVNELQAILGKLSSTRFFWYSSDVGFGTRAYEALSLGEPPYVMTPAELRIQGKSSRIISLEEVFLERGTTWPFITTGEGKELVVAPRGANRSYKVPEATTERCDINQLEKILGSNPLALVLLRKAFSLEVAPDLQELANQYVHNVALIALNAIRIDYHNLKLREDKIQQIEARYNSPQRETGMFATRPVIPDPEPDPFLAAIMSYDTRCDRDRAMQRLATYVNDLDRTGLAKYDIPLEEKIGVGQMTVSNLAEFAGYVRGVLEICCKAREKAVQ